MTDLILYGSLQSGHSYKCRLYLLLAGIEHEYRHIDIFAPHRDRPAAFREISPYGEVPVLQHEGRVLAQSNAILLHLARHFGSFGATQDGGWDAITQWLFWEANRIGRSYPNLRFYRKPFGACDPGLLAWFEQTASADLDRLDRELTDKPFLLDQPTIADLSCAGYMLYQPAETFVGLDFTRWPHITAWLDRIRALPGFVPPLSAME